VTPQDYLAFAQRYMDALVGDAAAVRSFYAPDAKIWHNTDNVEQTVDQNMQVVEWLFRTVPDRRFRVLRREALPDGFLQQQVMEGTLPDGTRWGLDACLIVRMKNGLITRLDEYLDSAQAAALRALRR